MKFEYQSGKYKHWRNVALGLVYWHYKDLCKQKYTKDNELYKNKWLIIVDAAMLWHTKGLLMQEPDAFRLGESTDNSEDHETLFKNYDSVRAW